MSKRAKDGPLLDELVAQCIPVCQAAESGCPRQGPGRRPITPDWVIAVMIMVAVMLKKKTKSAQFVWWCEHAADFARWLPGQSFPARSTFFDRYRRVHGLYRQAIALQGQEAIQQGWADATCVAADKSLIAGLGPRWSASERNSGKIPRGVDVDTTWGYCHHDGWVQGYSFEVVVTAPADGVVWPLLASVDTASRSEQKSILDKIAELPDQTEYVLLDAGYDSNAVGETVEGDEEQRTGRRCLCPPVPRPNTKRQRQPHHRETRKRQHHRRLRDSRRKFLASRRGQALYARRKTTVEPFHAQLKHLFELEHRVWHRGLDNNRTMLLGAIAAYQLLLTYNHRKMQPIAHLQRLLDAL
jgi:Transposase DDE domain